MAVRELDQAKSELPQNFNFDYGDLGGVNSGYDQNTKTVSTAVRANPAASGLYNKVLNNVADFDNRVQTETDKTVQAYRPAAEQRLRGVLGDIFYQGGGTGGTGNSTYQAIVGNMSKGLADEEAAREIEIKNQVKQNLMNQDLNQFNIAYQPLQALTGQAQIAGNYAAGVPERLIDIIKGKAGIISDAGNRVGDIRSQEAQANIQRRNARMNAIGQAVGGISQLGGQFLLRKFAPV